MKSPPRTPRAPTSAPCDRKDRTPSLADPSQTKSLPHSAAAHECVARFPLWMPKERRPGPWRRWLPRRRFSSSALLRTSRRLNRGRGDHALDLRPRSIAKSSNAAGIIGSPPAVEQPPPLGVLRVTALLLVTGSREAGAAFIIARIVPE